MPSGLGEPRVAGPARSAGVVVRWHAAERREPVTGCSRCPGSLGAGLRVSEDAEEGSARPDPSRAVVGRDSLALGAGPSGGAEAGRRSASQAVQKVNEPSEASLRALSKR